MRPQPPASARRFLAWYCRADVHEEVQGDLDEAFEQAVAAVGARRARIRYWKEVVLFMRSHTLRDRQTRTSTSSAMLTNHIRGAVRGMRKQKLISTLNVAGLAVGLACMVLAGMFVREELSYDQYHTDIDRMYRVNGGYENGGFHGIAKINGPWGVTAAAELPAIEAVTRFSFYGNTFADVDGQQVALSGGLYADSTVFDVFSWPLLSGDAGHALRGPGRIVLTETTARSVFGTTDVMGREVRLGGSDIAMVTGVMADVPRASHFTFPFLLSMASNRHESHDDWWRWNQYYTYVTLAPGADPVAVSEAITGVVQANLPPDVAPNSSAWLQPVSRIYLHSQQFREMTALGSASRVWTLAGLAALILVIAALNFVTLSTARSGIRSREVGVRKVLGAGRYGLVRQFMTESTVSVVIATVISLGLAVAALDFFNDLTGKGFAWTELFSGLNLALLAGVAVVVSLSTSFYPALVQSRARPVDAMRGQARGAGMVRLRQGLVVLQFGISAILLMATGIVTDQLQFLDSAPLGFDREHLVAIPFQDNSLSSRVADLRTAVEAVPGVEGVTLSGNRPGGGDWGIPVEIPGVNPDDIPGIRMLVGDASFPEVYGMALADGRSFDVDRPADQETAVLVNQEFVRQLGWDDPLGRPVLMPGVGRSFEVTGVVEDFHFRSMHEQIAPLMIFMAPDAWYSQMTVRLRPDASQETLDAIGQVYARFDPVNAFRYTFIDEQFDALYAADRRVGDQIRLGTWFALIVACMGLFGLATFTAQRRTREIGVRKVVGATEWVIVRLLTRETVVLVTLSLLLAAPVAWWIGQQWLADFAYATSIGPGALVLGAGLTMVIAVGTTAAQAWRAAQMDPVKAIRTD